MKDSNSCKKVQLAGGEGCRVVYCETHQVAEMEIGALSLRFDIETFANLQVLMTEAQHKIQHIQSTRAEQEQVYRQFNLH
jgi:hypothetical protein